MRLKFEKVVVVDFFAGRFGEKARLIKNQQDLKNVYTQPLPQFFASRTNLYRLAVA